MQANIYPLLKECNITHRRLKLIIFEKGLTNFLSVAMFQEDGNGPQGLISVVLTLSLQLNGRKCKKMYRLKNR